MCKYCDKFKNWDEYQGLIVLLDVFAARNYTMFIHLYPMIGWESNHVQNADKSLGGPADERIPITVLSVCIVSQPMENIA